MTAKKYKLIANPAAGRGKASSVVHRAVKAFKSRGLLFDLEHTQGPCDAANIARRSSGDFDVIVAIGGDGTVNEIVPGMLSSGKPLAIIPGGTGNDFIKTLRIPNNVEQAMDIIVRGSTRMIDVGRINGFCFVNAVGFGFDAAVNQATRMINHSKQGLLLYLRGLIKTLGKYDPVPLKITMNGNTFDQETFLLAIGNGTTVGGGFKLTPHAKIDDQLLDVTIVKPLGLPALLFHLPKVFRGTFDKVKYAALQRTERLVVETRGPVPIHIDGEIYSGEETRFTIEVVPRALMMIDNLP